MLCLKRVGKQFGNGRVALREVSLEIAPQTILSVVGTSGSGKSTLLRIVSGLEAPTTGFLTWDDQSIVGPRRDIGFIFQESRLMPWLNVTANVALGLGPANQSKVLRRTSMWSRLLSADGDSPLVNWSQKLFTRWVFCPLPRPCLANFLEAWLNG